METDIKDNTEPSELVLEILTQHFPYSLPALRRIQFMKTNAGRQTKDSYILSTFDTQPPGRNFLVAYLDFSRGPNTEMWLYSSIENGTIPGDETVCEEQVLKLLKRVGEIERAFEAERVTPGVILVGSLHKRVLQLLEKHSLDKNKTSEHFKFLFRTKDLPQGRELPEGLTWSTIRPADIPLVLSRTSIPYKEELMKLLPSVAIETSRGVPIAWAFLGSDGSLKTLHCEEKYRGRGFAKAVSLKLFHESAVDLVKDGLYHADVAVENLQSQGVCKSLHGTVGWSAYFTWASIS